MLVSYSQQSDFEQAIIETFGGDRPCEVCKFIQAIDEETSPTPVSEAKENKSFKLLSAQAAQINIVPNHSQASYYGQSERLPPLLYYGAPTPPPRPRKLV